MDNIKKILIFKLCCFGDIVFITPVITSLRKKYPEAEITFVYSSWVSDIIPFIEGVDDSIVFDIQNINLFDKIYKTMQLILKLRKIKYDIVFLGHRNSFFGLILLLSGIRNRFGFSQTKFINKSADFDSKVNEPQRYLNVLQKNNINTENENIILKKPNNLEEIKKDLNISNNDFIIGIFPFGGINPGTDMDIKRWDIKNYIELIDNISKKYPEIKIILFEGKQSNEKVIERFEYSNFKKSEIDMYKISICNIFISGDTGPLHIAAAFGVATLSIFGPSDPLLVSPVYYDKTNKMHRNIWLKPKCSPCYTPETSIDKKNKKYWNNNNFVCNIGTNECIKRISKDVVFNELEGMLKNI